MWESKKRAPERDNHMDGENVRKFSDLSLQEIIEFRRLTNLVYGAGVFDSMLEEEVADCLKILKKDNVQIDISDDEQTTQRNATKVTMTDLDVAADSKIQKSFAEVVKNKQHPDSKKQCETDDSIPLKPIPSPKIIGGNVVVEIDEKDYNRGLEHLRFSVLRRLSLLRGDSVPTTGK